MEFVSATYTYSLAQGVIFSFESERNGHFFREKMIMEDAIVQLHITYEFGLVHRHFLDLQQQKLIFEFKIFFFTKKKYFQ